MKTAVVAIVIALAAVACTGATEGAAVQTTQDVETTAPVEATGTSAGQPAIASDATESPTTQSSATDAPAPTTATTTTEPIPELLPIPDPVTEPPDNAGDWGDVVVSVESFWNEVFADFAGSGSYDPLDRTRIVAVSDGDRSIPDCGGSDITARSVEDNAFAVTCREGQLILWDEDDLFDDLEQEYGATGPTVVIAHEFGHVIQAQSGVLRRTASVIVEQQADCLSGAFAAWANDRGIAPFDEPAALDAAVGATVSFRDRPGSSANSGRAHGSGFDRVRAFQDGFDRGVEFCAGYPDTPPPITEILFGSDEIATGGNLPFADLVDLVVPYMNDFFAAEIPGWEALNPTVDELSDWIPEHRRVGDNATGTRLALLFAEQAQGLLGIENSFDGALLQQACIAGGAFSPLFFPLENSPEALRLSAGDLDESVITLSRLVEDDSSLEPGFLFELIAALRVGFTDGISVCGLP